MRRKILSIQNIACETLGALEEPLRSEGYELYEIQAHSDQIPKCADEFSAIIILGGPMSVYEGIEYLKKEQALIWDATQKQVPTLGICLGSQLIAGALGGTVHRGIKKEIGWHDIHITSAGLNGLFKGFGQKDLRVFQWHGDTYTLPPNTKILAYSDLYPQAFQIGNAYGLQFHLEVTMGMIRTWLEKYKEETTKEGLNANSILPRKEDEIQELNTKCKKVWSNFSEIISSRN
ncbi:MAG: type 1 glutamine amidotransferase [Nitrososphaeraceae archaeon]|nr:type 1 glutamine amidotransferase [Nitrososphaeraceae archaeon]MDW0333403.1 type 1 glutamine amidotransferase [Nitrososphaeraceae archaeon]